MDALGTDIAGSAHLLADRSRVAILLALARGEALPAGELARAAAIGAASASAHLARLARAGLVEAVPQGRHRYYRLAASHLPELLETLAALGSPVGAGVRSRVPQELRLARWCYGHLGGRLAVALAERLASRGLVTPLDGGCVVTPAGAAWLRQAGLLPEAAPSPEVRVCRVDWSERRPHLAGALGRALARRMIDERLLAPVRASRGLRLTARGHTWLRARLELELAD